MATETDTLLLQIKADNTQIVAKLSQTEKVTISAANKMTTSMEAAAAAILKAAQATITASTAMSTAATTSAATAASAATATAAAAVVSSRSIQRASTATQAASTRTVGAMLGVKQAAVQVAVAEKAVVKTTNKMNSAFKLIGVTFAATFALRGIQSIAAASDEMVRLNARLLTATKSANNAAEAMGFLQKTAKRQSVDLLALSDGYVRLLPAVKAGKLTMNEMRNILSLTNDNMKAFGLRTDEVKLLFFGLSQVLGSGTVTMEDLKQVTERMPGSFDAVARAMGKGTSELRDFIATGQVTADMIKGPLLSAFKANEGAAEAMSGTLDSANTRMDNSLRLLSEEIGKGGINDAFVNLKTSTAEAADGLTRFIKAFNELKAAREDGFQQNVRMIEQQRELAKQEEKARMLGFTLEEIKEFQAAMKDINAQATPTLGADGPIGPKTQAELFDVTPTARDDEDPVTIKALEKAQELEDKKLEIEKKANEERKENARILQEDLTAIIESSQGLLGNKTREFQARMDAVFATSGTKQVQASVGALQTILGESAKHNKKLFEINKAAGIANAVISTAVAIMKSYDQLGPIAGTIAAVGIAALGAAQIATISSQSFSGGGGGGGGGAASPAASAATTSGSGGGGGGGDSDRGLNVSVSGVDSGSMFSGAQIREIMSKMNDEIDNGAILKQVSFT